MKIFLYIDIFFKYMVCVEVVSFVLLHLRNAKCGKVQCTNVDLNTIPPNAHVSIQEVQGSRCVNADFNMGPDVLDPAYVNPGSPCAEGKVKHL